MSSPLGNPVTDPAILQQLEGSPSGVMKKDPEAAKLSPAPPTYGEMGTDALKSIVPGMLEGAVAIPTAPTSILEMGRQLGTKAPEPVGSFFKGIPEMPFTFPKAMGAIEDASAKAGNPIYKSQTPAGEIARTASSFVPSLGLGTAENLGVRAAQTVGGGLGAGVMGQLAKDSDYRPAFEMAGALLGAKAGPRAVTPFPIRDPNYARSVGQLSNEGVDLTAARRTGSPGLLQFESNLGVKSGETPTFSRAFLKQLGINADKATPQELANAQQQFRNTYDSFVNSTHINYTPDLLKAINKAKTDFARVGGAPPTSIMDTIKDVTHGVSGKSPVLSMPGPRYQHVQDLIESRINGAANNKEKQALIAIKNELEGAFKASLPSDAARSQWDTLNRQYANWNVLTNSKIPSDKYISPDVAINAIAGQRGNQAVNLGQGGITKLAQAGQDVLGERPQANTKVNETIRGLMSGLGAAAGYRYGGAEGLVGGILGREIAGFDLPRIIKGAANSAPARKIYESPAVQAYLSNQVLPPNSTSSINQLLRALAGSTTALPPQPSQ